jgi:hypothetical protein
MRSKGNRPLEVEMPFTPEAQAKRAQIAAVYEWLRRRLVLIIVAVMMLLQFLTWQAVEIVAQGLPRDPPRCSEYDPCNVYVKGSVTLDSDTVRRPSRSSLIGSAVARISKGPTVDL